MKYTIVAASSAFEVASKVQRLLDDGWELFGAPFSTTGLVNPIAQAMVLRPNIFDMLENGTNQTESSGPG